MNPLAFLSPYKLLIEIMVVGAILAGIVYEAHEFLEHEREIGRQEVRAQYAQAVKEAKEAADKREAELRNQVSEAVKNGNEREQTIRTLAAASGASSISLRDAITGIRNGVPSATVDALRQSTTTLSTVLTDCQGRYRALAEVADRHASDAKTLTDAWPKN